MSKYMFNEYTSSAYKADPIFNSAEFSMYGEPGACEHPIVFEVDDYRYVLISPNDFIQNETLSFKVAVYLYHHETILNERSVTYFFGDIKKCEEVAEDFIGQILKYVSYDMVEEWYPKSVDEINSHVVNFLLNRQSYYGKEFSSKDYDQSYLFFVPKYLTSKERTQNITFIRSQIFSKGLLKQTQAADNTIWFVLTPDAIDKYQKRKTQPDSKLAFIAIRFKDNEERIQAIQDAITDCGFIPRVMNEYETNNWIMPEIFHQISISRFVVVDLSIRCDGAYYEAGYAQALGKEVIQIYDNREKDNNPLHFDVAQKSTVMYDNFDEMKTKLKNRIVSTVM